MMEALAVLGWLAALVLWVQRRQHTCQHEAPSKAVLIAAFSDTAVVGGGDAYGCLMGVW